MDTIDLWGPADQLDEEQCGDSLSKSNEKSDEAVEPMLPQNTDNAVEETESEQIQENDAPSLPSTLSNTKCMDIAGPLTLTGALTNDPANGCPTENATDSCRSSDITSLNDVNDGNDLVDSGAISSIVNTEPGSKTNALHVQSESQGVPVNDLSDQSLPCTERMNLSESSDLNYPTSSETKNDDVNDNVAPARERRFETKETQTNPGTFLEYTANSSTPASSQSTLGIDSLPCNNAADSPQNHCTLSPTPVVANCVLPRDSDAGHETGEPHRNDMQCDTNPAVNSPATSDSGAPTVRQPQNSRAPAAKRNTKKRQNPETPVRRSTRHKRDTSKSQKDWVYD